MPRVHSFDSCQIYIYPKDHMPPHFHVLSSDGREWLVRIDDGEVMEGARSTRSIRAALEWASVPINRDRLLQIFWELHT
jgi:hypothetical protein